MKQNRRDQETQLLDKRHVSDLPPDLQASIQPQGSLQDVWSLHQKALQLGEDVREKRNELPNSVLGSQGYLNRLEAQLSLRKQEQKRQAWWRRVSQVTWSSLAVAASVGLLWWVPQKLEKDIEQTAAHQQFLQKKPMLASAKKDNMDLWLQRLGGGILEEPEEREASRTKEHPLAAFVNGESDDVAPISQTLPETLEDFSVLSSDEE